MAFGSGGSYRLITLAKVFGFESESLGMISARFLDALGTTCKRYGPGRLPKADRRDVGAGYSLASAATGVTLLFALTAWTGYALGPPIGTDWEFFGTMALVALPLVVPTSFVSAVVVWRTLPSDVPYFGAIAGFLATLGTYLIAILVLFALYAVAVVIYGQYAQILEAAAFLVLVGSIAFVSTFWLTLPIGTVSGIIHERVTD